MAMGDVIEQSIFLSARSDMLHTFHYSSSICISGGASWYVVVVLRVIVAAVEQA